MLDRIHYISQGNRAEEHFRAIQKVLDGGGSLIQLRYKIKEEILPLAERVKVMCDQYNATLIINDFVDVAKQIDASGVHLGLSDSSVEEARQQLGSNKLIGGTANTVKDVKQRIIEGCDYIGLGPFRFTSTKEKLSPLLGAKGIADIIEKSNCQIPVYAIGGIEIDDIEVLMETGIYGIAVSGLLSNNSTIEETINELKNRIHGAVKNCR